MSDTENDDYQINVDKKHKMIQFTGEISSKSVHSLKDRIMELVNVLKKSDERVVHLHLQSEGGCLFSGIGMFDWCTLMKSTHDFEIYCYGMGLVASAASMIFMAGGVRLCGRNSYFLIHSISTVTSGIISTNFEEEKQNFKNDQVIMDQLTRFYKEHTTITDKMLGKCMKKDVYMTYDQCVKYGIDTTKVEPDVDPELEPEPEPEPETSARRLTRSTNKGS